MSNEDNDTEPFLSTQDLDWKVGLSHLLNHVHMTVSLLLLFIAYNGIQNLASSIIDGTVGYWSLASIYASLCVTTLLVAGSFVAFFKPKISLIFGTVCYISFIIANLWPRAETLIPTAVALGIGGAILWAAQGTYLTQAASNYSVARGQPRRASMGLFTGLFFGIFQMSQVIGNLISSFLLKKPTSDELGIGEPNPNTSLLMYVYIGLASAGCISFLLLRPEESSEEEVRTSLSEKLFRVFVILRQPKMFLLLAIIFYSGMEQAFIFGIFTGKIITPSLGQGTIGYVMATFGAVDTVSSLIMGKVADMWGGRVVVLLGTITQTIVLVGFFVVFKYHPVIWLKDHEVLIYVAAMLWAVGDAAFNLFPNLMMSLFFTDNSEAAFATLKFFQALGSIVPFIVGPLLNLEEILVGLFGFLVLAIICLFFLHFFVAPIAASDEYKEEEITTSIQ